MKSAVIQAAILGGLLDRLPVTFSAFFLDQVKGSELLFPPSGSTLNVSQISAWAIEAAEEFSILDAPAAVSLSYSALETYRTKLMAEVDRVLKAEQIRGPRQLGARPTEVKVSPGQGIIGRDPLLADFVRSVLLNGNGTLLINNTFVEWASVQAIRRARPCVLAATFGTRDKMKPFSNLPIYADQDKSNPIPSQMDVLGTSVDLEIFYQ